MGLGCQGRITVLSRESHVRVLDLSKIEQRVSISISSLLPVISSCNDPGNESYFASFFPHRGGSTNLLKFLLLEN